MEARMSRHPLGGSTVSASRRGGYAPHTATRSHSVALSHPEFAPRPYQPRVHAPAETHPHYEWRIPMAAGLFAVGGTAGWMAIQWLFSL